MRATPSIATSTSHQTVARPSNPLASPQCPRTLTVAHFKRSRDEADTQTVSWDLLTGTSLDETLQGTMSTAAQHARESLGWLRHAFQDPDDFSASAIGRMVSKEYGRHERPHTERHLWAAAASRSPVSSSAGQEDALDVPQSPLSGPKQVQVQQPGGVGGWMSGWGWNLSSGARPQEEEVYHSPPSGPGFLLQQQAPKRQD